MSTQTQQSVQNSSYKKKIEKISKEIVAVDKKVKDTSREEHNLEVEWVTLTKKSHENNMEIIYLKQELRKLTLEQTDIYKKLKENARKSEKVDKRKNQLSIESIQLQTKKTKLIHMDMCKTLVKENENEKKIEHNQLVKKSNIESSKKFLNAITNTLPEDIVSYIATFIPTTVRIQLLESRVDFANLTNHISQIDNNKQIGYDYFKIRFLEKLCNCPEYLNSLSNLQRKRHMNSNTQVGFINAHYSPDWHISFENKRDIQTMFQYAILKFKSLNPEHAFKIMKTMSILIDPTKNYRYNANYREKVGNYSL